MKEPLRDDFIVYAVSSRLAEKLWPCRGRRRMAVHLYERKQDKAE